MILSDTQLIDAIQSGWVKFDPEVDLQVQVQPASVDLRLGPDVHNPDTGVDMHVPDWDQFGILVNPGDFLLCSTLEEVHVPPDLVGRLEGRSSLGRLGIVVHATAGFIDPGFYGQIILEVSNISKTPRVLHPGQRVCQITLMEVGPVSRPYGHPDRRSKYQGQVQPVPSLVHLDVDR